MECRLCCAAEATVEVGADDLKTAVRNGFNPFREKGLMSDYVLGMMSPGFPDRWARAILAESGPQSSWPVCDRCRARLHRYIESPPQPPGK